MLAFCPVINQDSCAGGVALLVHQRHVVTFQHKWFGDAGYILVAEVGNLVCGTICRKPNTAASEFVETLSEFLQGAVRGRQWLLIGDWNILPRDSLVVNHLTGLWSFRQSSDGW